MAISPLTGYVPPSVYTKTLFEANAANLVAGVRIPFYIGVGQEDLDQTNLELVRGSSSNIDQQIVSEDVSSSFVVDATNPNLPVLGAPNGVVSRFRVRNYPIVDGQGFGVTTNAVRSVAVTINGEAVAVGQVQGSGGYVTLQVPPQVGDNVRCTYFFHRGDTVFTDTVSDQVTTIQAILTTPATEDFSIVASTTDTFIFEVDGEEETIVFPAGTYTAVGIKSLIDGALITGLSTSVFTDNQGLKHVRMVAAESLVILSGNANGALGFAPNTQTSRNADFRVFQRPIVDGTGGGITTTDPTKVVVVVNGTQVVASAVDGTNGIVTLPSAPATGSTVTIQYYANTWQDTFDYLPNTMVTEVTRSGFAPGRSDYIEGQDFVVSNPSADVSVIHWGSSYSVAKGTQSPGADAFDDTQIIPSLVDDKLYLVECTRYVDTTVVPALVSPTKFVLPEVPTTGNGRDTPLGSAVFSAVTNSRIDLNTNRPDLIIVRAGHTVVEAMAKSPIAVKTVDNETLIIDLKEEVPPDQNVYATFWYSRLQDDTYILTCKVPGAVGSGQYEVLSSSTGTNLYQVRFGTKAGLSDTVQWPRGVEQIPDAFHTGDGTPVAETVTVTFDSGSATNAIYTNTGEAPYSFFAAASDTWRTTLSGNALTTDLSQALKGFLVSSRVELSGGNITITTSNNELELTIDGVEAASTGSITTATGANLIDGETFTLDDGVNDPTVFEFDSNASVTVGNVAVTFTGGDTATQVRDAMIAAINGVIGTLLITASIGASNKVTLTNDTSGTVGNALISDTVAHSSFVTYGMTGGDGQVKVVLTTGSRTPVQIVADINNTIDAISPFIAGAPNTLASTVTVAGDAVFVIKSYTTPAALPDGFDHSSVISVRQGTAEVTLGFEAFQSASGSSTATNKPATILGTIPGPFVITAGVNDTLDIRVDGIDYTITLTAGAAVTTATLVTDIDAVISDVASVGTLTNLEQLRLTSPTISPNGTMVILGGTANDTLGLSEGDTANMTLVEAQEVVNALMTTASFTTYGVAYVSEIEGSDYVTIETVLTGTSASVVFVDGATSAFNEDTGTEIVPGTSGDVGEAAGDVFAVTSSHASGSSGDGVPGQTYTDAVTGLRFTVLPATDGSYTSSGSFTLLVSQTFNVTPAVPWLSIGGLEVIVSDTVDVGINDTATIQTFNPGGLEPAVGDFYFITYKYRKQDFSTRLFQQFKVIEANFGALTAENRVSLASYLAIINGAVLVGIKQVLKVENTNQASDASFISAIADLATPLPGQIKPDVLVPLATSSTVYQYLMQHCEIQSNERNQNERMGFIGFASGTVPTTAQAVARSLLSNRIVAVYPDSAVITFTDENNVDFESLVDGTFLAAALAGAVCSPAVDVATPYTRRRINGFDRLPRVMDPITANQTAVAGITILEDLDPVIRVRHGLTTNMTSILTRLPTVTQSADFVQEQTRIVLDAYIGSKFLASKTNDVEVSLGGMFRGLTAAEIVAAYTGITAEVSPDDPTSLLVSDFWAPIFPLLYILSQHNLRSRL